jgi:hypothetical protein
MVTDTMGDTPALWEIVQRSSGGTVAEIQSHNSDDAALVAAAPELLAALLEVVGEWDSSHADEDHRSGYTLDTGGISQARAAIARATGGQ